MMLVDDNPNFVEDDVRYVCEGLWAEVADLYGAYRIVQGPCSVKLSHSTIRNITKFVADEDQYLSVRLRNGNMYNVRGPAEQLFLHNYESISVYQLYHISKDVILHLINADNEDIFLEGPVKYMPLVGESILGIIDKSINTKPCPWSYYHYVASSRSDNAKYLQNKNEEGNRYEAVVSAMTDSQINSFYCRQSSQVSLMSNQLSSQGQGGFPPFTELELRNISLRDDEIIPSSYQCQQNINHDTIYDIDISDVTISANNNYINRSNNNHSNNNNINNSNRAMTQSMHSSRHINHNISSSPAMPGVRAWGFYETTSSASRMMELQLWDNQTIALTDSTHSDDGHQDNSIFSHLRMATRIVQSMSYHIMDFHHQLINGILVVVDGIMQEDIEEKEKVEMELRMNRGLGQQSSGHGLEFNHPLPSLTNSKKDIVKEEDEEMGDLEIWSPIEDQNDNFNNDYDYSRKHSYINNGCLLDECNNSNRWLREQPKHTTSVSTSTATPSSSTTLLERMIVERRIRNSSRIYLQSPILYNCHGNGNISSKTTASSSSSLSSSSSSTTDTTISGNNIPPVSLLSQQSILHTSSTTTTASMTAIPTPSHFPDFPSPSAPTFFTSIYRSYITSLKPPGQWYYYSQHAIHSQITYDSSSSSSSRSQRLYRHMYQNNGYHIVQ